MTPETLKLLAEALGYENVHQSKSNWCDGIACVKYDSLTIFNPESNPAQREEVLLWLADSGWEYRKVNVFGEKPESQHRFRKCTHVHQIDPTYIAAMDEDYTTALLQAAEKGLGNE